MRLGWDVEDEDGASQSRLLPCQEGARSVVKIERKSMSMSVPRGRGMMIEAVEGVGGNGGGFFVVEPKNARGRVGAREREGRTS